MMQHNTAMDAAIYEQTGYKTFTTFAMDFEIADTFGVKAIKDTFKGACEWLSDYKYWTELVMILNWNIWKHQHDEYGLVYNDLWAKAEQMFEDEYADKSDDTDEVRKMKKEARLYYYQTLD